MDINSIHVFDTASNKSSNYSTNQQREDIIAYVLNGKAIDFIQQCEKWRQMDNGLRAYMSNLHIGSIDSIQCIQKGGRQFKYDFIVIINNKFKYQVEFKFNSDKVLSCPQFCSPSKPSRFLYVDFADWFYDNYLSRIAGIGQVGLVIPEKKLYLKTINNNKVKCMEHFKAKYDTDVLFRNECKRISSEAIKLFVSSIGVLNIEALSTYFMNSQQEKHYLLYKDGVFNYDKLDNNLFQLTEVVSTKGPNYIVATKGGDKLEIKLRWKNGCGINFPAFQVKQKNPSINELKKLCLSKNIEPPKLKKDIFP